MLLNRFHLKKLIAAALVCGVLYTVAGFLVLPVFIKSALQNYFLEFSGQELQIEQVEVNPFTLALAFSNTTVFDAQRTPVFELEHAYVNFDITGLMQRSVVIRALDVLRPQLTLKYYGAGETNLSRLLSKRSQKTGEETGLPAMLVKNMNISQGSLQLIDTTTVPDLRTNLQQIDLTADNITSDGDERGNYTLMANDAAEGKLRITGDLSLNSLSSRGNFALSGLDLPSLYPWFRNLIVLGNLAGRLELDGDYALSSADQMHKLKLSGAQFSVKDLYLQVGQVTTVQAQQIGMDFDSEIVASEESLQFVITDMKLGADVIELKNTDATKRLLSLDKISVSGGSLDWQNRKVNLSSLSVAGGTALYMRDESGLSDWTHIIEGLNTMGSDRTSSPAWLIDVDQVKTADFDVKIADLGLDAPVELVFDDIELLLSNLSTAAQRRSEFELKMAVNGGGHLQGSGWLSPADAELQAAIILDDLDLMAFAPYLASVTTLQLRSGWLNADINAQYQTGSIVIDGRLGGRDLVLLDAVSAEPVLKLDAVKATRFMLKGMPLVASVDSITLDKPYAKIEISADRDLNLSAWFKPSPPDKARPTADEHEQRQTNTLTVDQLEINNGNIDFSDFSLSPSLNINIDDLTGAVTGLGLDAKRTASLDLNGRVNEFGSARISGRLRPLDPVRYSEINMLIRNIPTADLSPYAARFAGRKIESGKLNLDLNYLVKAGKLDGNHDIELVDLVLGERVESADAPDLPLDLAVALLQDSEGRIKIAIPISGDLDNPSFDLRAVISKAVGSLVSSVITAPFKFLGSLLGGSDKAINSIPFDPGSAAISPPALETITELSKVLGQRPGLALRAEGSYDPKLDRDALARQQLRLHVFLAAGLEPENPTRPRPIAFFDPKIQDVLDEFALSRLGIEKPTQVAVRETEEKATGEQDDADINEEAYYEKLFDELVGAEEIPRVKLERVARYRAQSIADQFEQLGVAKLRVLADEQVRTADSRDQHIYVDLAVEPGK